MALPLNQFKNKHDNLSAKRLASGNYPKELTIVAEGDSWFDYPLKKDIIDYLRKKGYAVDKFSAAGDTLENMTYGSEYKKKNGVITHLRAKSLNDTLASVEKHQPKIVLFSGGGNDIVGSEILGYLNHKVSKPTSLINKPIFKARLKEMEKAVEYFITSTHAKSKNSQIIMDGYDYAKVNGKGYSFFVIRNILGPWILPSMAQKAILDKKDQNAIVKYFVDEFNGMLKKLSTKYSYFHHLDLRGMFPNDAQWHNEIHLKNAGFKEVANLYHAKIVSVLNEDPIVKYKSKIIG